MDESLYYLSKFCKFTDEQFEIVKEDCGIFLQLSLRNKNNFKKLSFEEIVSYSEVASITDYIIEQFDSINREELIEYLSSGSNDLRRVFTDERVLKITPTPILAENLTEYKSKVFGKFNNENIIDNITQIIVKEIMSRSEEEVKTLAMILKKICINSNI